VAVARQVLRWLLVALLIPATLVCLVLAIPAGGLTLPLAIVFGGLLLALLQGGYEQRPRPVARWLLYVGLALFLLEIAGFLAVGVSNWS
jgi:hypothetical protein